MPLRRRGDCQAVLTTHKEAHRTAVPFVQPAQAAQPKTHTSKEAPLLTCTPSTPRTWHTRTVRPQHEGLHSTATAQTPWRTKKGARSGAAPPLSAHPQVCLRRLCMAGLRRRAVRTQTRSGPSEAEAALSACILSTSRGGVKPTEAAGWFPWTGREGLQPKAR